MRAQVLDFAQVDSWRAQRTGFPEVVFGGGKSAAQIAAIMAAQARNDQVVLATRIAPEVRRMAMRSWRLGLEDLHVSTGGHSGRQDLSLERQPRRASVCPGWLPGGGPPPGEPYRWVGRAGVISARNCCEHGQELVGKTHNLGVWHCSVQAGAGNACCLRRVRAACGVGRCTGRCRSCCQKWPTTPPPASSPCGPPARGNSRACPVRAGFERFKTPAGW